MAPAGGTQKVLDRRDVLMFVRSEDIVRLVLPHDTRDRAIQSLRATGGYSAFPPSTSSRAGRGGFVGSPAFDSGNFGDKPIRSKELPEAEVEAVRRAWAAVHAKGKTIHVVDVGKESIFRRVIEEHLHHLHTFPVLVRPDGRRLEGVKNFTPEDLEKFLSD